MVQQREQAALDDIPHGFEAFLKTKDMRALEVLRQRGPALAPYIEQVIAKYTPSLRTYAMRLLHNESDVVDDLLQNTWIELYLKAARSDLAWLTSRTVEGWLKKVLYNAMCDYKEQQRRRPMCSLDADEEIQVRIEQISNPFEDPNGLLIREEFAYKFLERCSEGLSHKLLCF